MTNTPDDSRFADGFLDDFFAEAEEHLTVIRRNLLALEAALPEGAAPAPTLEEMFRAFHSLKGISGMVELQAAETLAHDMESYLRVLRSGEVSLSREGIDALMDSTHALEGVIAARRADQPIPSIDAARQAINAVLPPPPMELRPTRERRRERRAVDRRQPPPESPTAPSSGIAESPAQQPQSAWRVTFVPSNELLDRGVNVNTVRERLRALGEIVQAKPILTGSGGIAFEFVVATDAPSDVFERWHADGISATRQEATAPLPPLDSRPPAPADARTTDGHPATSSLASRLVRVDLARLDNVMRILADLVVSRGRLDEALEQAGPHLPTEGARRLEEVNQAMERQLRELRESVMRVRLVPVREIFSRMPFVVRDLARDNDKQVKLELRGQDTEIDKFLIERMMDPILHLVRNAISHGIEPPAERLAHGKPAAGTIGLHAATLGEMVVIEVQDDGRGVDRKAVVERARAIGVDVPEEDERLLDLLCTPGFSTREEADRASGRGVGMAVVKQAVEQLSGSLDMQTEPGRGTRFVITLPVTLAIIDALICTVGGQRFAVPQTAVREVLSVDVEQIRALEHNEVFPYRNAALPLVRVADVLSLDGTVHGGRLHVIVVGTGTQGVGLAVDRIQGQREIVVRAVTDPLVHIEGIAGATELGDGQPVLILDPPALLRLARRRSMDAL